MDIVLQAERARPNSAQSINKIEIRCILKLDGGMFMLMLPLPLRAISRSRSTCRESPSWVSPTQELQKLFGHKQPLKKLTSPQLRAVDLL